MGKQAVGMTPGPGWIGVGLMLGLFGGLFGQAGAQNDVQGDAHANLQGTFVNEAQSQDAIRTAVDAAVARMNFVTRPIARSRLKKTNAPHRRVEIVRTEQEISVAFDGNKPVRMPADGRTVKWTRDDGETFDVSATWSGDRLVQTFKAEDGQRTNTFNLGADAKALTVQVEVTSPQLPAPVRYSLSFARS